jgi:YesN/AraC family two-component response regulator
MKKILVVDDEAPIRNMLNEYLSEHYAVHLASNGQQACALLATDAFDLVITDLVMPDMNGIDLVMAIQKQQPSPRVIAISGGGGINGRFDYLPVAQLVGAERILRKPFALHTIGSMVEEVLR